MSWRTYPIVAFDTETTGLRPFEGDRVMEFGAVVFHLDERGNEVGREEHGFLINPGIPVPKKSTEVTGITTEDVAGMPPFSARAQQIYDLLKQGIIVAHNLDFDRNFIGMELRAVGLDWPGGIAEVDTLDMSNRMFPTARSHRLSELCKRLGVNLEEAHRAVHDAAACGESFLAMARDAADDLNEMLYWAGSIGPPPADGPLRLAGGLVRFAEGPHRGQPVREHPAHLAWMIKARQKRGTSWGWRYPDSTRAWAARWLEVMASGRAQPPLKGFRAEDWGLYPCVAPNTRETS
ncbi:MAG: 3'-5' exonuclease [Deltaproteobacteria bacterium]|nr:3'-5' exonuclease [Deltaproteobacteria bacterium]